MPDIRGNQTPGFLLSIHMSFGLTILALMFVRLIWRLTHPAPPESASMPQWQKQLAVLTHYGLYTLLIFVPLFGWAWASSRGWPIEAFGVYTMPPILAVGSSLGRLAGMLHSGFATILLLLIGLHVAAALYHRYMLKDDVLDRMMPQGMSI